MMRPQRGVARPSRTAASRNVVPRPDRQLDMLSAFVRRPGEIDIFEFSSARSSAELMRELRRLLKTLRAVAAQPCRHCGERP